MTSVTQSDRRVRGDAPAGGPEGGEAPLAKRRVARLVGIAVAGIVVLAGAVAVGALALYDDTPSFDERLVVARDDGRSVTGQAETRVAFVIDGAEAVDLYPAARACALRERPTPGTITCWGFPSKEAVDRALLDLATGGMQRRCYLSSYTIGTDGLHRFIVDNADHARSDRCPTT